MVVIRGYRPTNLETMLDVKTNTRISCKYCGSTAIIKYGKYKAVQRYLCKACLRKIKADSASFHMKVSTRIINRVLTMYYEVVGVSHIQKILKEEYSQSVSKSIIYKWIKKYTDSAVRNFKDFQPLVGTIWIVKESLFELDGHRSMWVYDVLDRETRFLLSSQVSDRRKTAQVETIIYEAIERSGKIPTEIIFDAEDAYKKGKEKPAVIIPEQLPVSRLIINNDHYSLKKTKISYNRILITREYTATPELSPRFEADVDQKKIPRPFKYVATFISFIKGWSVYYNYFKTHDVLGGLTPAEKAQIKYGVKKWTGI